MCSGNEWGEWKTFQRYLQPDVCCWILSSKGVIRGLIFSCWCWLEEGLVTRIWASESRGPWLKFHKSSLQQYVWVLVCFHGIACSLLYAGDCTLLGIMNSLCRVRSHRRRQRKLNSSTVRAREGGWLGKRDNFDLPLWCQQLSVYIFILILKHYTCLTILVYNKE